MGSQLKMGFSREQTFVRTQAKPLRPKPRQHQGHFDPEELTRRLYIVLADQKARAERKRARAEDLAKLKEPRSWNVRHLGRDAAERGSKEAAREKATRDAGTSQSSLQTSSRPAASTPSGELKTQKPAKLSVPLTQRKESRAVLAKDTPECAPEPAAGTYHHVPQEAAKQFERTTTVGTMRDTNGGISTLAHKLSKQAVKLRLAAGAFAQPPLLRAPVIEESPTNTVERLVKDRERVDQWRSNIPEEPAPAAAEEEQEEEYHVAPQYQQHSFRAELARLRPAQPADQQQRRNSTGDIPGKGPEDNRLSMVLVEQPSLAHVQEEAALPDNPADPPSADERRADWTQSDEQATAAAGGVASAEESSTAHAPAQRHKPLLSPLLRKADSIWSLRGRLGSGGKAQEKGDMPQIPESPKSPMSPKSSKSPKEPKGGFFAKFKR